jgi:hypothetical protein
MKNIIIKKGHFHKGLLRDSYNRKQNDGKKWNDNNLLDPLEKYSQFQKCGILKLWKFKNSKLQECFATYK